MRTVSFQVKDDLKRGVVSKLRYGRDCAITGRELAFAHSEPNDRRIRLIICELIRKGWPIASSNRPPLGFYLVQNEVEANEYIETIRNRIKGDATRLRDFRRATRKITNPSQLAMAIG